MSIVAHLKASCSAFKSAPTPPVQNGAAQATTGLADILLLLHGCLIIGALFFIYNDFYVMS